MKQNIFSLVLGAFSIVSGPALAELVVGTPSFYGSGCPAASVETVVTPDQSSISLLFSKFTTVVGSARIGSVACNVTIPLSGIPSNKKVVVTQNDFSGFLSLPRGAHSIFSATSLLKQFGVVVGGSSIYEVDYGPYADSFYVEKSDQFATLGCGGTAHLNIDARMTIVNMGRESASFTLDTSNLVTGSAEFHLLLVQCP